MIHKWSLLDAYCKHWQLRFLYGSTRNEMLGCKCVPWSLGSSAGVKMLLAEKNCHLVLHGGHPSGVLGLTLTGRSRSTCSRREECHFPSVKSLNESALIRAMDYCNAPVIRRNESQGLRVLTRKVHGSVHDSWRCTLTFLGGLSNSVRIRCLLCLGQIRRSIGGDKAEGLVRTSLKTECFGRFWVKILRTSCKVIATTWILVANS